MVVWGLLVLGGLSGLKFEFMLIMVCWVSRIIIIIVRICKKSFFMSFILRKFL